MKNTSRHSTFSISAKSGNTGNFYIAHSAGQSRPKLSVSHDVDIGEAITNYIRALRSLGRTKISTQDIAKALGVPISEVNNHIPTIKSIGARVI